ncbi:MAG TPA: histidine phosphatase family protein, partial [Xanthobacteraceae bacterium]|nr:histidine phosphatase family protein [Xanthobacteraceae bacterium]
MPAETHWWWIRHAPVPDNLRIYGQNDVDSDCTNAEIFRAVASEMPKQAVWITSSLARTMQTADAIMAQMDERHRPKQAPIKVPEFAEQHLGEWQGMVREEFYRTRKPAPFWFGLAEERAPGGESFNDLVARVKPGIERLTQEYAGRNIVAVAHGGTIKAMLAAALELSPDRALAFSIDNCSIT